MTVQQARDLARGQAREAYQHNPCPPISEVTYLALRGAIHERSAA